MRNNYFLCMVMSIASICSAMATIHKPTEAALSGYVMVYHKDATHGLHMAYSWDGQTWTAFNDDRPIMEGDTIAEQQGIRDPYIFRSPKGGICIAMTDLHVFGKRDGIRQTQWERSDKYGWGNNRGLVLLKSDDMIHWRRTNLDFSKLKGSDDIIKDWRDVGCVWAPEMNWDEEKQQIMMHFTTRYKNGRNVIYFRVTQKMTADTTKNVSEMFRFGMRFQTPEGYENLCYYGRGPWENYSNRNHASRLGLYRQTVNEQFHPYVRVQETGTRTDMRWLQLCDMSHNGIEIRAERPFSASALHYSQEQLDTGIEKGNVHPQDIQPQSYTFVSIDVVQMGQAVIDSWAAKPSKPFLLPYIDREFTFTICPF